MYRRYVSPNEGMVDAGGRDAKEDAGDMYRRYVSPI
jgi:hypothetical protein